jgi:hypothetical protein
MFEKIQKSWSYIAIVLLVLVLAGSLFWPGSLSWLSMVLIAVGLILGVFSAGRPHWSAYQDGKIGRSQVVWRLSVVIFWVALTTLTVILAGMNVARYAGTNAGIAAESAWPGSGTIAGIIAGLLAGFAAGFLVGMFMQWLRGLFEKPVTA